VGTKALLKAIGTFLLIVVSTSSNAQTVDFDSLPLARIQRVIETATVNLLRCNWKWEILEWAQVSGALQEIEHLFTSSDERRYSLTNMT
jgi:hypothetical protein